MRKFFVKSNFLVMEEMQGLSSIPIKMQSNICIVGL